MKGGEVSVSVHTASRLLASDSRFDPGLYPSGHCKQSCLVDRQSCLVDKQSCPVDVEDVRTASSRSMGNALSGCCLGGGSIRRGLSRAPTDGDGSHRPPIDASRCHASKRDVSPGPPVPGCVGRRAKIPCRKPLLLVETPTQWLVDGKYRECMVRCLAIRLFHLSNRTWIADGCFVSSAKLRGSVAPRRSHGDVMVMSW